ncbi:uncharacterized protein LOC108599004 [Drosophila busckii]|uniref:uncharacterized protein LOC108599004 n=1 Tax=Drosophila busckii TaxID=30019 RepID=UPI00083EDEDB|nr:uncharacterized protein LOC108599004 [Drosophila busckii]
MWKRFAIYAALLLCLATVHTAVIRQEAEATTTTQEWYSTTVKPEESTTIGETLHTIAVSPDQEASVSVQIGLAKIERAVNSDVIEDQFGGPEVPIRPQAKSADLLLLSTPAKRPADAEQQLEEQDENEAANAGSAEASVPTTTLSTLQDGTTTELTETTTMTDQGSDRIAATTKLFAINATTAAQELPEPNVAVAVATDNATTISIAEQPQHVANNYVTVDLTLVQPELDYVLVDGSSDLELDLSSFATHDELQLGSFTHIDSDVHSQPVVHSVEIVPTRVNYLHNLH